MGWKSTHKIPIKSAFIDEFQFPTGWNSTIKRGCLPSITSVSIPNGMEFYLSARDLRQNEQTFQFPTGWNSTRNSTKDLNESQIVSIPNGMEFYPSLLVTNTPKGVSIPNGMEFYACELGYRTRFKLFQFPTGWNSTLPLP